MREIVLDTETTGLDPLAGHRVVEVGCIELVNTVATGRTFHAYFNPEMLMPAGAQDIHGLSDEFLADKPRFAERVEEFLAFVGDAMLVIHNASFDIGFLNAELKRTGHAAIGMERVVDTLALARRKHPGAQNSLDALCSRYGIDNSNRVKHGALLDAELLAEVYIELTGGRQTGLAFEAADFVAGASVQMAARKALPRPVPLPSPLGEAQRAAHAAFIATLGEKAVWRDYLEPPQASAAA